MTKIRVFEEDDLSAVVTLFERVYPDHGWTSQAACASYFREIFFNNPWRHLGLSSWVAEVDRRIAGFYGVVPRPMLFGGHPIRVAVGCCAMVHPDRRNSLIALQLIKACVSGDQHLTFVDGATERVRRMWVGIGGKSPLALNLHWTRPLRPAAHALALLQGRAALPRALAVGGLPVAAVTDAIAARLHPNQFLRQASGLIEEPVDPAEIATGLPDFVRGLALQPMYDTISVAWLLAQTGDRKAHGTLRARRVLTSERRLIGWYIYYLRTRGVSEVIQLVGTEDAYDLVVQRLFADAWRHGATAVRGRLDPNRVQALSKRHCWLRWEGPTTLVHTRHAEIMDAILQGNAFLSRLDGEWWMRFLTA